jgi:hypothetical protein
MSAGQLLAKQFPCKEFPDVEKLGLVFRATFLRFDANRVFEN